MGYKSTPWLIVAALVLCITSFESTRADSLTTWWVALPLPVRGSEPADTIHVRQWRVEDGGNGHWYAGLNQCLYWVEAHNLASTFTIDGRTGYLATITSPEENSFIFDSVMQATSQPCILDMWWIGGVQLNGNWTWITGEPFVFQNWAPGEPNNSGSETALSIWGHNTTNPLRVPGTWNNGLTNACINPVQLFWAVIEWGDPAPTSVVPVCGNGVLDPGEQCDDGNTSGNDLCSPCCEEGTPCGSDLLGDVNCDGCTDLADVVTLGNMLDHLIGPTSCSDCTGDVDIDGDVDEDDFNQLYDAIAGTGF